MDKGRLVSLEITAETANTEYLQKLEFYPDGLDPEAEFEYVIGRSSALDSSSTDEEVCWGTNGIALKQVLRDLNKVTSGRYGKRSSAPDDVATTILEAVLTDMGSRDCYVAFPAEMGQEQRAEQPEEFFDKVSDNRTMKNLTQLEPR